MNESSSAILSQHLQKKIINSQGSISFADFMEQALYHPLFGYYQRTPFTIGRQGDFITAPHVSPLFAKCIAQQCKQILSAWPQATILEIGAGTGQMACDLLQTLTGDHVPVKHYFILEISPTLRNQQRLFLEKNCAHLLEKITWLDTFPENFLGIILANEVLDALPCPRFKIVNNQVWECCVTYQNQQWQWVYKKNELFTQYAQSHPVIKTLPDDYESELHSHYAGFIQKLTASLKQGIILLFDYGYGELEYYDLQRHRGTLTCFYQHEMSTDPFQFIGEQDISVHVNFTEVVHQACIHGLQLLGFTTQQQFLLACNLIELADQLLSNLSVKQQYQLQQAIKILTWPSEMGERIKVMALAKNINLNLQGFMGADRSREL